MKSVMRPQRALVFGMLLVLALSLGVGAKEAQVTPGIEMLLDAHFHLIDGKCIGLITNMTGVDSQGRHIADLLLANPQVKLAAFFAPEHGLRGDRQAGEYVASYTDPVSNVPVHSLYGRTLRPTSDMLRGIDVLIFDIQDVGTRFYTYIYTMAYAMEAAAAHNIPFVVLDRPNPIGGKIVEGPILEPKLSSFVGLYPIALRHGMTVGELAQYFNAEFGIDATLTIVPMRGWQRDMWFDETGLPWVPPSPNMMTLTTATVYPGLGLIEGTNVSEGRGTDAPFETIGAPWINGPELANTLNALEIAGVRFHPTTFTPTFSKFTGTPSQGVRLEITDRSQFEAVTTGLHVIGTLKRLYPTEFAWRPPSGGRYFFDQLTGTESVRWLLDQNAPAPNIARSWQEQLNAFLAKRSKYLIYD